MSYLAHGHSLLRSRAWRTVSMIVLAFSIGSASLAYGLVVNGVVEACYNNTTGALRVATATRPCLTSGNSPVETAISWNQVGPQGPQGPKGDQGIQGIQGEPGVQGPPGPGASAVVVHSDAAFFPSTPGVGVLVAEYRAPEPGSYVVWGKVWANNQSSETNQVGCNLNQPNFPGSAGMDVTVTELEPFALPPTGHFVETLNVVGAGTFPVAPHFKLECWGYPSTVVVFQYSTLIVMKVSSLTIP